MDKGAIKNYAVWARRKLIEDITQKAFEIGVMEGKIADAVKVSSDTVQVNGRLLQKHEARQREALVARVKEKGFGEVIEEAAYTWFNRIIAIRFMEVNEYLPTGVRVLSSTEPGKAVPDIITNALHLDLDLDLDLVNGYLDNHNDDELFRYLFTRQCNKLNEILPGLFEKIEDYNELLLPNNLLIEGSVIRRLVSDISEEDFREQVEIIGWLYQYYISEKKDQVFAALKKNVKITKENIPAATQLFTPDWIVKYMVENSLGRLWLEGHPDEELKSNWKYYLEEAEQEPEVQKQLGEIRKKSKDIKPEEIKVLDPCMGSGHILVYAFDVLFEIYKSAGYAEKNIPKLILENNLYGLEIDDRSAQLAYFAVMMKARSKSRRIFREQVTLNLCSIRESNCVTKEAVNFFKEGMDDKFNDDIMYLIRLFYEAKEFGSIIQVNKVDFEAIEKRVQEIEQADIFNLDTMLYYNIIKDKFMPLIKQARILSQKYDVVCTNPPYMGKRNMNTKLIRYLNEHFKENSVDLYSVFIEKCIQLAKPNKYIGMITQHSWMFLSSFKKLRADIVRSMTIISMVHLGSKAFEEIGGEVVQTNSYIICKQVNDKYFGSYIRLVDFNSQERKEGEFFQTRNKYFSKNTYFVNMPNYEIMYWVSQNIRRVFDNKINIGYHFDVKKGMDTGNNDKFVRLWHEVEFEYIKFNAKNQEEFLESNKKWAPYIKGGKSRKWYGNTENIVFWENNGAKIKSYKGSTIRNEQFNFNDGVTWTDVGGSSLSARYFGNGFLRDNRGPAVFGEKEKLICILSFMCSKLSTLFQQVINPTMCFQVGNVKSLPVIDEIFSNINIKEIAYKNLAISKNDWDTYESSWDFIKHPILRFKDSSHFIRSAFDNWSAFTEHQFVLLKHNEEKLNHIFIDIYGLQRELTPEVEDKDITIRKADVVRDVKSFISYTVGCMFGRYSIDVDGLIYAGGEWRDKWQYDKVRKIEKDEDGHVVSDTWVEAIFLPDDDNILPILDDEYFDDDIVSRFIRFLQVSFGEETLEDNLNFIAGALGRKASETSRQALRRYFLNDFYKDHVQTYQKRPIYWLFDSGKEDGFKALIYMHRYDEFTVARVRTDYLHRLQRAYEAEVMRLDNLIDSDVSPREKTAARKKREKLQKQMQECFAYDQVIAHVANQRIKIDLDDGVKVNYTKFQGVEVPQGDGKKPLKADLLAKI